ncbi:hypothetical protein CYY_001656 [Polysphondylium violaceum]|uniref:Uncharacterized protein n=1 Tax=Polysphondylium violaceum TaxID=133409 RepID=A0A8J4VAD5_9MYCE|nr:hypothetical protein CYY_001656 [Polysphondylium violaceum]
MCVYKEKNCTSSDLCQISSGCDKKTGQCILSPVQCNSTNKCETTACDQATGKCQVTKVKTCPPIKALLGLGILCQAQICDPPTGNCIKDPNSTFLSSLIC